MRISPSRNISLKPTPVKRRRAMGCPARKGNREPRWEGQSQAT
jgi:hypothetical protein